MTKVTEPDQIATVDIVKDVQDNKREVLSRALARGAHEDTQQVIELGKVARGTPFDFKTLMEDRELEGTLRAQQRIMRLEQSDYVKHAPSLVKSIEENPYLASAAVNDMDTFMKMELADRKHRPLFVRSLGEIASDYRGGAANAEILELNGWVALGRFTQEEVADEVRRQEQIVQSNSIGFGLDDPQTIGEHIASNLIEIPRTMARSGNFVMRNWMGRTVGAVGGRIVGSPGQGAALGGWLASAPPLIGEVWMELEDIEGLDTEKRRALAIGGGAVSSLLESMSIGFITKNMFMNRKLMSSILTVVGDGVVEGVTEASQGFIAMSAWVAGQMDAADEQALSFGEYVDQRRIVTPDGVTLKGLEAVQYELFEQFWEGAKGGVGFGTTTQVAGNISQRIADTDTFMKMSDKANRGFSRQVDRAASTQLAKEDPEAFHRVTQDRVEAGQAPEFVEVDKKKFREFFQGELDETEQEAIQEHLPGIDLKMNEDVDVEPFMSIAYADFQTYIAPTKLGDKLKEASKLDPVLFTPDEVADLGDGLEAEEQQLKKTLTKMGKERNTEHVIRRFLTEQYSKIPRMGPDIMAGLVEISTSRVFARAQSAGVSVRDLLIEEGLPAIIAEGKQIDIGPGLEARVRRASIRDDLQRLIRGTFHGERDMPTRPVTMLLKDLGGVDPDGSLAGEFLQMIPRRGPGSIPGFYRKGGFGSLTARLDELTVDTHDVLQDNPDLHGEDGRIDVGAVLEAISEEIAGRPLRTGEQAQAIGEIEHARGELEGAIATTGIELSPETLEQLTDALTERDMASQPTSEQLADSEISDLELREFMSSQGRGSILLDEDLQSTIIRLTEAADGSTMLHEAGHLWLAQMQKDAQRDTASQQLKRDWNTIKDFLGLDSDTVEISEAQHEKFARSVELRVMQGEAPSTALGRVFDLFSSWLTEIYRTLKGKYFKNIELTDPVRGALDRLIATDNQIREAQYERDMAAVTLGDEEGFLSSEIAELNRAVAEGLSEAHVKDRELAAKETRRDATEKWKAERARIQEEVESTLNEKQVWKVRQYLAKGIPLPDHPFPDAIGDLPLGKMNRQALMDMFPDDRQGILKTLTNQYWQKDGGVHPDRVAEAFGYNSTFAMIAELADISRKAQRDAIIKSETDIRLNMEQGTLKTSLMRADMIAEAVLNNKALSSQERMDRVLSTHTGRKPRPASVLRNIALRKLGQMRFVDIQPDRFSRQAMAEGRRANQAQAKQDWEAMQLAKQRQLYYFIMEKEGRKLRKEMMVAINRSYKKRLKTPQKDLTLADPAGRTYVDAVNYILTTHGFPTPDGVVIAPLPESLKSYSDQVQKQEGLENRVSSRLIDGMTRGRKYQHLTPDVILEIDAALSNILHNARIVLDKHKDTAKEGRKQIWAKLREDTEKIAGDRMDLSYVSATRNNMARFKSSAIRLEFLLRDLGPSWTEEIMGRINRMNDAEHIMKLRFADPFADNIGDLQHKSRKRGTPLSAFATTGELATKDNKHGQWTRAELISMVMNLGAEENHQILQNMGLKEEDVLAVAERVLHKEDVEFMRKQYALYEKMWPFVKKHEETLSGAAPPKVKSRAFKLKGIEVEGGYVPIFYDMLRTKFPDLTDTDAKDQGAGELFSQMTDAQRMTTAHNYARARGEPLDGGVLNFGIKPMISHMSSMIHDLTHREGLIELWNIVNEADTLEELGRILGPENQKVINRFLKVVKGGEHAHEAVGQQLIDRMARKFRMNAAVVNLGLKASVILKQPLGGLLTWASLPQFGIHKRDFAPYYREALSTQVMSDTSVADFTAEKSTMMRVRLKSFDRGIREITDNLGQEHRRRGVGAKQREQLTVAKDETVKFAMNAIGQMQFHSVDSTYWLAMYNYQIDQGVAETKAISEADAFVRMTQGAGDVKDAVLSMSSEAREMTRAFTMHLTYLFTVRNTIFPTFKGATRFRGLSNADLASQMFLAVVAPAIGSWGVMLAWTSLRDFVLGGFDDEDDDALHEMLDDGWSGMATDAALAIGREGLSVAAGPFSAAADNAVRAIAGERVFSPSTSLLDVVEKSLQELGSIRRAVEDGELEAEESIDIFFDMAKIVALWKGVPIGDPLRVAEDRLTEE